MTMLNRRHVLAAGSLAAGAAAAPGTGRAADGRAVMRLTPTATQGPFWFDPDLIRSDITEGLAGVPLGLELTVCEPDGRPAPGALLEIWHCDPQGRYSGYDMQGGFGKRDPAAGRFLRGGQQTDAAGKAAFSTLYPGWYEGRTPHIHVKVMLSHDTVLTSQIFLPDALSEFIFGAVPAYQRKRVRDTLNTQDGIAQSLGGFTAADLREEAHRYRAAMTLVVDRSARSAEEFMGPPPGMDGGPPFGPPGQGPGPPPGMGPPGMGPPGLQAPLEGEARIRALVPGLRQT